MMATTTSVVVGTPGVASRFRAWSLRMARAAIICGSPSSATAESTDRGSMVTSSGTANFHCRRRVEELGSDAVQGEEGVGLVDFSGHQASCSTEAHGGAVALGPGTRRRGPALA